MVECEQTKNILNIYEVASSQMVNKEKTTIFFSRDTDDDTQEAIKVSLSLPTIQHYEKYLGLPSFVGRNKKACFTHIKDLVKNARMEREVAFSSGQRSYDKSSDPINPGLLYECVQITS